MPYKLPINLIDLLRQRTVESERIEYKAGWNPDAVVRTLCAFANDFENLGGWAARPNRPGPRMSAYCSSTMLLISSFHISRSMWCGFRKMRAVIASTKKPSKVHLHA